MREVGIIIINPNLKINKVVRMAQAFINDKLKEIGLSSGLFYFILELLENDGLPMQELSRAVLVDNAYTTRAVNRLIELGYVDKKVDPNDSRSFRVYLTAQGTESSGKIKEVLTEWANLITANVTQEELGVVYNVFDKYYFNARIYFKSNS
jgi:DNA-binding MarR family transcriptional regulator